MSLLDLKTFLSILDSNLSYFIFWFFDDGDKSTIAAETNSLTLTKSIPNIGISYFGSGKNTQ